jgi:lysophospholipase L1-like esterase
VLDDQLPAFLSRAADPEGPYDVGCLYVGINDVRGPAWDVDAFATSHSRAVAFLVARCARVLCVTAPHALGRPRAARVAELNDAVLSNASTAGTLVLSLGDFGARNHVMADRVHPTALGQVAIARRALAVLAADGLTARVDPATLVAPARSRGDAVRGDWTYVYRTVKHRAQIAARRSR